MFESFISSFCKVEFLCYQGDPNWLGLILLGIGALVVIGIAYLDFAGAVANELGDKKWAKKIYRNAEKSGMVENDELADEIERSLGDKEWAKKIKNG